jgi:hypothetical protein
MNTNGRLGGCHLKAVRPDIGSKSLGPDNACEVWMNGATEQCHHCDALCVLEYARRQQPCLRELFCQISQDGNVFGKYDSIDGKRWHLSMGINL